MRCAHCGADRAPIVVAEPSRVFLAPDEYQTVLSQIGQAWANQGLMYPAMVRRFVPHIIDVYPCYVGEAVAY